MIRLKALPLFIRLIILLAFPFAFVSALLISNKNPEKMEAINTPTVTDWIAPKYADKLKNPLEGDAKAAKEGKSIYTVNCASCHGNKGEGNGPAAAALNPKPKNLTSEKVQSQTDGAIFWKITTGNPPMVSWQKVLTEKQRWSLVDYIRQIKTK
jgi:mono/diheme cytochrome c family protein